MNSKHNKKKSIQDVKRYFNKDKISKTFRVTYDVFWNVILFFIVIGVIGVFFAGGVGAGYFASLVKDEPIRSYEDMEQHIYDFEETSKLYFADNVYLGDIRTDLHREIIELEDVSETLIHAVIATEDEYFHEHKGIVPKAIVRAVLQEVLNSNVQTGGSTLTQQLIKNQILTNEVSFERKAKEILLALRLEQFFSKDEILESYLNIIPYGRDSSGRNIAGIQTAAQGVFGLDVQDLNLAQSAYLAGLPQSPSAYTPFTNGGDLKEEDGLKPGINRMKTVLKRMHENEYITKEEYEEALEYPIQEDFIEKKKSPVEEYPFLTYELQDRAKDILMEILAEKDGYTLDDLEKNAELHEEYRILADRDLRRNGYNIHSTIDKKIYDAQQKVAREYPHYGPDRKLKDGTMDQIQLGSMLIENKTGKILSFVGGREFTQDNEWNYATNAKRSNGSTMKPLLDYAPAMELGVIQPGSVLADIPLPVDFPGTQYKVGNYGGGNYGLVSARQALASSYNIPAAKVYSMIINEDPVKNYLQKMGFSSIHKSDRSNDHLNPSMSLGGMTDGVTVEENTNAYTTFSNGGKFIDGYMIDKITTHDGTVIYEHEPEPVDVFSPQTSYLMLDMMRDVIKSGTANYLQSQLKYGGVDWAGKTGTTNDYHDAWFIATNPNVTMGTWIGYNTPYNIKDSCYGCSLSYSQRNLKVWAELMNVATDINPELMAPKERFKQPEGIVSRSYCAISGLAPSKLCQQLGLVRSDIYNSKFVPTKVDDSLVGGAYVVVDGKAVPAGPDTPKEFIKNDGYAFNPDFLKRNGYDRLSDLSLLFPRTNRDTWEKIGFKGATAAGSLSEGGSLSPPGSVAHSGETLTWKKGSGNVVGYRVYRSTGDNFKLVGSTQDTNFKVGKSDALYVVRSVDFSGKESDPSKEVQVGKSAEELEKEQKEKEEQEAKEKEEQEKKEKEEQEKKEKEQKEKEQKEKEQKEKEEQAKKQAAEKAKEEEKKKEQEQNNQPAQGSTDDEDDD